MKTKIEIFQFKFTQTTWNEDGTLNKKEDFEINQLQEMMKKLSAGNDALLDQMRFCYKHFGTRKFEFESLALQPVLQDELH